MKNPLPLRLFTVAFATFALLTVTTSRLAAQTAALRGRVHLVWDEARTPGMPDGPVAYLVDDSGRSTRLLVDGLQGSAAYLTWDRRRAEVLVDPIVPSAPAGARRLRGARLLEPAGLSTAAPDGVDHLDFITVLCRFADDPQGEIAPARLERVMGSQYPGMQQYYAEQSGNPAVMSGNRVTARWYNLPQVRSYYVQGLTVAFGELAADCARAAEADVNFADYYGINLQFNGLLSTRPTAPYDTLSFGGSWSLTLNGQVGTWGMTWIGINHVENYVVHAHEMGHALGWPHSSGRYGVEYDSDWDVMSKGYLRFDPAFGWLTVHTIGPYKNARGWTLPARRWQPAFGAVESRTIVRSALSPDLGSVLAVIPRGDSLYYTAEARLPAGHDTPLPGGAILLHEVDFGRAYVVDADHNGNPNDAGAEWTPGETFTDSLIGFALRVDSAVSNGFAVTITRGWRLDVAVTGGGAVRSDASGRVWVGTGYQVFAARGTEVELTPVPPDGWVFNSWSGACAGTGVCRVTMNGARAVGAEFGQGVTIQSIALRMQGMMGAPYADTMLAAGGGLNASYSWLLTSGALPAGLVLDPATGVVSGTPTTAGLSHFTFSATSGADEDRRTFTVTVVPVLPLSAVLDQLFRRPTTLTPDDLRLLDLVGNRNERFDVGDVLAWLISTGVLGVNASVVDVVALANLGRTL